MNSIEGAPLQPQGFREPSDFNHEKFKDYWEERLKHFKYSDVKELGFFLQELKKFPSHSYSTIVDACIIAMQATRKYVGEGISGFQAEFIGRALYEELCNVRGMYQTVRFEQLLYPQYLEHFPIKKLDSSVVQWLGEEAAKRLKEDNVHVSEDCRSLWTTWVNGVLPEGFSFKPPEDDETPDVANN